MALNWIYFARMSSSGSRPMGNAGIAAENRLRARENDNDNNDDDIMDPSYVDSLDGNAAEGGGEAGGGEDNTGDAEVEIVLNPPPKKAKRAKAAASKKKQSTSVDGPLPPAPRPPAKMTCPPMVPLLTKAQNPGPSKKKEKKQLETNIQRCEALHSHVNMIQPHYTNVHKLLGGAIDSTDEYVEEVGNYTDALTVRIGAQKDLIGDMKLDIAILEQKIVGLEERLKAMNKSHINDLANKDKVIQSLQIQLRGAQSTIANFEAMQLNDHKSKSSVEAAYQKNENAIAIKQKAKQKENEKTQRNVASIHSQHMQYAQSKRQNQQNQQFPFQQMSQNQNGGYDPPFASFPHSLPQRPSWAQQSNSGSDFVDDGRSLSDAHSMYSYYNHENDIGIENNQYSSNSRESNVPLEVGGASSNSNHRRTLSNSGHRRSHSQQQRRREHPHQHQNQRLQPRHNHNDDDTISTSSGLSSRTNRTSNILGRINRS